MFPFLDVSAEFFRLLEGQPEGRHKPRFLSRGPEHQDIDPLVRRAVVPKRAGNASGSMLTIPRLEPGADPVRKLFNDGIGHAGVNVSPGLGRGHAKVSPLEMNLSVSTTCFWGARNRARTIPGGRPSRTGPAGGHPPAQANLRARKEGRGRPGQHGPILDGLGAGRPPFNLTAPSGIRMAHQRAARAQASVRRPQRKRSLESRGRQGRGARIVNRLLFNRC